MTSFHYHKFCLSEFILQDSSSLDDKGLATTRSKMVKPKDKGKGKQKTANPRRMNQKMRYVFNHSIKSSLKYLDYFKPDDQEVEDRLLALSDTAVCNRMELISLIALIKFFCYRSLSQHLPRKRLPKLKLKKPRKCWT